MSQEISRCGEGPDMLDWRLEWRFGPREAFIFDRLV
jgi:hypothetical protein